MDFERGKGLALWRQIQKQIEQEILSGNCVPGEKLPTERIFAERFGVNRHTVRQALAALVRKSMIHVEQGRGYFVCEDVVNYELSKRVRFSENLIRQRLAPCEELLDWKLAEADSNLAALLALRPGAQLLQLKTLGKAGMLPLCLTQHFFPYERFAGFADAYSRTLSITAAFQEFGVEDYTRLSTIITARMPSAAVAQLLSQSRNRPVMYIESVSADKDGAPIECAQCTWAADRMQFELSFDSVHG